jgi:hypothetical protein
MRHSPRPRVTATLPAAALAALVLAAPARAGDGTPGEQQDTGQYELRLEEIRTCASPAPPAVPGKPATARTWVGAAIQARARVNELYVSARDFSLERGGVVVQAHYVDPPALPRCQPLLLAKQLTVRQSARGFVLFELPPSFRTGSEPLVLAYRPTRWGGAARVEFRIQPCLDSCPKPKPKPKRARD